MTRSDRDCRLLDRFLDNALTGDELAACRRRLELEPALRAQLQERAWLRRGFTAGRDDGVRPPAGFAAGVVAAARRLPAAAGAGDPRDFVQLCRRLLLVAAAVLVVSAVWHSGLFSGATEDTLQAAPDEVKQVLELLDARIRQAAGNGGK